ncbi:Hypothetical protein PHPALM_17625 [Phytophthora palmivora]|uniref:CCHC-type domain-containing protein n=1 Tax=Phytophthora palmivora TaxID=4796 RepID=A0A2P4XLT8_9STRA|nr:Hypothetical protein PHPALM_17625 [Phytophthora palmivora]
MVDAGIDGTVTLEMEEIRQTERDTPEAATSSTGVGVASRAGGRQDEQSTTVASSGSTSNTGLSTETGRNGNALAIGGNDDVGDSGNRGGADPEQPQPVTTTTAIPISVQQGSVRPIVVREKAKSLKLNKFKGLDDVMPVTMWLKTVRAEVRRQAVTMGVEWREKQLYHEVAAHLEGEAQRWFATVMESVPESEETIGTLADMLRAKYMTQLTGPEVVDLLNARRQMRSERLVEYAQALREIGERGDVDEDWLVNAFLKGMSSPDGATHVRGHRPRTLDEAVALEVPHIGEYGEGYDVGLGTAMNRWDEREASRGRGPLVAASAVESRKEQSGLAGNFDTVVSGYDAMWGTAEKPPRDSKVQTTVGRESGVGTKRPVIGDQNVRSRAKALKVEGQPRESVYGPPNDATDPAFETRGGRLRRNRERLQQRAPRTLFVPRAGTRCHYCNKEGHFVRDCAVKRVDLAGAYSQSSSEHRNNGNSGNEQRA